MKTRRRNQRSSAARMPTCRLPVGTPSFRTDDDVPRSSLSDQPSESDTLPPDSPSLRNFLKPQPQHPPSPSQPSSASPLCFLHLLPSICFPPSASLHLLPFSPVFNFFLTPFKTSSIPSFWPKQSFNDRTVGSKCLTLPHLFLRRSTWKPMGKLDRQILR